MCQAGWGWQACRANERCSERCFLVDITVGLLISAHPPCASVSFSPLCPPCSGSQGGGTRSRRWCAEAAGTHTVDKRWEEYTGKKKHARSGHSSGMFRADITVWFLYQCEVLLQSGSFINANIVSARFLCHSYIFGVHYKMFICFIVKKYHSFSYCPSLQHLYSPSLTPCVPIPTVPYCLGWQNKI